MKTEPDVKGFVKRSLIGALILAFFHVVPWVYAEVSASLFHRQVAINSSRHHFILLVAYALIGFGIFMEGAGLAWVLWRNNMERS